MIYYLILLITHLALTYPVHLTTLREQKIGAMPIMMWMSMHKKATTVGGGNPLPPTVYQSDIMNTTMEVERVNIRTGRKAVHIFPARITPKGAVLLTGKTDQYQVGESIVARFTLLDSERMILIGKITKKTSRTISILFQHLEDYEEEQLLIAMPLIEAKPQDSIHSQSDSGGIPVTI